MHRLLPLAAVLLASLLLATPTRSTADSAADSAGEVARITRLTVRLDGERVLVGFDLAHAVDAALRRRLASGLPTGFVYEAELLRDRKRWLDKVVRDAQLQVVAMYNAATREYLVNYKLDGVLVESQVVRDPEQLERALTHFEDLPIFTVSARDADGERMLVRIRAELGTRTVFFFIPAVRTTDWVESAKFRPRPLCRWRALSLKAMDLRARILRLRKDSRVVAAVLATIFVLSSLAYYVLLRGRGLPKELLANRVLLFALWYVNVILILTIVFVLVRNFFRLLLERRNRILGSRFKTKLVLTAIGLSLIPVLILFPFATRLLLDSFESFFTLPVEEVLAPAAAMAGALVDEVEATSQRSARRVLGEVIGFDLEDLGERPALHGRLQDLREELGLDYLAIFDGTEPIHSVADPVAGFSRDVVFRNLERLLREAIAEGEVSHIEDAAGVEGRLILAARAGSRRGQVTPEGQASNEARRGFTVVVAGRVLPPDLAGTAEGLERAYQAYLQLVAQKEGLRTQYLQTLLMVTLLVILAFSSIGLRLARRVTAPIQALADGTRRISSGDLDHRVEVEVDDELAVLVDGFNSMTQELKSHRELVDRSNRELLAANRRLAAILENVAAGVLTLDREGRIVTCNDAALSILAQGEDEVVGRAAAEAWSDTERGQLAALLESGDATPRAASAELRITLGGVYKTLEVKVTGLPATGGVGGGRVVVLEDLTELIQAQKMATWHEVARRIAHEIKNPLTPIKLTAERLLRRHQQNDPQLGRMLEEGVEIISREVDSMKTMVDEFSRFARMPQPRPRQVDLESLIGDTLSLYQSVKPGVAITSDIDPAAREARFDPEQLKSVLINLLDNAIEATDPPGRVTVATLPQDGRILVQVRDTGRGVRPEDRPKLFLPYFSTKGRGTGLGLAIVHRLVHDNFATLRVEDNEPRGTVFTVEIPLA